MSNQIKYQIESDGTLYRVEIRKDQVTVLPSIIKEFQSQMTFRVPSLMDFDNAFYGQSGIVVNSATPDALTWSVRVRTLNLNCWWQTADKIVFPDFACAVSSTQMELPWRAPDSMRLMLVVGAQRDSYGWQLQKHYLVAYDNVAKMFRLPLSNLYDHCELCHGQDAARHPSALKAMQVAMEGFKNSQWNSDLYSTTNVGNTKSIFGFDPDNTGFKQRTVPTTWTDFCKKVANDYLTANAQPL